MTETATKTRSKSEALYERARAVIPGGVNSPARAMKAVESDPLFIARADGAYLFDVDGGEYIDYVGSWGPMILGHRHPRVLAAIESELRNGTSYGAPCRLEVEMAELVGKLVPSMEMVRMVNSGTEATMSALRLARAYTGKKRLIKFDGCYHGHGDSFLVKAGSGLATLGISSSPGVPEEFSSLTVSIPYNDVDALNEAFEKHDDIAAVIFEPVVGNAGVILPEQKFLKALRELTEANKALLICDEVMTGFRVALGGAQQMYDIKPDLTCLGKIIGAGLPVGAYGGKKEIMERVAPSGDVYQAGTLSGNPLAMAAGLAQLQALREKPPYEKLTKITDKLAEKISEAASSARGPKVTINHVCGMISVFLTDEKVVDFDSAAKSDTTLFGKLWRALLEEGVYWPPSQFEAAFPSTMHSDKEIDATAKAFEAAFKSLS
ncbi:MAG: glutamate-1-semialdehyde 2,1-aminomutase [Candidatus Obscuribacterales bacterium]|nr:glutamate-1-semialdehyde 2,1-aminomutase [Cyanobacteria bacterium HKST-UBA01]MCB9469689.1 glutamate-1-semialdehyde 2,1-aminomutase [Candidatus Obscuribacterales bacterium]